MDNFDKVYSYLTEEEGLSPEEASRAMVIMVEQGFDPTQVFLRGLSSMLGFLPQKSSGDRVTTPRQKVKKPEMAKPIRDPWNQFPKKPQPQQGLPKTGPSSPLPTQKALPPAKPISTPNQTQGMLGSRSVPTSRQLGQAPRPQFGPDKARQWGPAQPPNAYGRIRPPADAGIKARVKLNAPRPSTPTARGGGSPISAVVTALLDLQGSTPQTRTPAQTAERERRIQAKWGDAMNKTPSKFDKAGPDVPATPVKKPAKPAVAPVAAKPKPVNKEKLSAAAKDFDKTFAAARAAGEKEFTWRGKRYNTKLK